MCGQDPAIAFDPLDFVSRLAALVPRPRAHLLTYHGILAPAAEWRDLGPSQGAYPSWTRDGRSVCSLSQPSHRIDCLRLDTGRVDPITDTSTVQLAVWVVVPWMGLDAQDRPLVTATTTRSTNLYALDWEP